MDGSAEEESKGTMETEIKTFVYRDSDRKSEAGGPAETKGKKKNFIIGAVCLAVIAVLAFAGFAVFGKLLPEEEMPETAVQTAAAETENTTAAVSAAKTDEAVVKASKPSRPVKVSDKGTAEAIMNAAETTQTSVKDESIVVRLLSENTAASDEYIPALAGAQDTVTEDTTGYDSKLEEALETIDAMTPPEDLPSTLVYKYNTKMCLDLDSEQIECLERIVQAEAGDQDVYGRMLVANVVINRVNTGWAKTVKGVVFQRINGYPQFEPTADYGNYYKVKVTDKTREAVRRVLAGEDYSQGATYFFQRSLVTEEKSAWFDNSLKKLLKYGCHEFYKEKTK